MEEYAFVRTTSHRSRDRLTAFLTSNGIPLPHQYYWNWKSGGCFVRIPARLLAEARKIAGVTATREKDGQGGTLGRCW